MRTVIEVEHLGKQYLRYPPDRPTTFIETIAHGFRRAKPAYQYWALRNVCFSILSGRMVGIIGANGAGKSTLLRMIGGVGRPDEGKVTVRGRIGALFDLGMGFHPDLTGRENVFLSGVIAGLTRREVAQRFDEIVAFAELAEWIDDPLRTYSSGMQLRLAFAVASHIEAEILLIDEVLAVGDIAFQRKCLERIADFKAQGCTVVLVTHDPAFVAQYCDEALWLDKGRVIAHGDAEAVISQYMAEQYGKVGQSGSGETGEASAEANAAASSVNRRGTQEIEITQLRFLNQTGEEVSYLASGHPLSVQIHYRAAAPVSSPIFGVTVMRDNLLCFESHTRAMGLTLPTLQGEGYITLHLERLDLGEGLYYFDPWIYEKEWSCLYDHISNTFPLTVAAHLGGSSVLQPPHRWEIVQTSTGTSPSNVFQETGIS